METLYISLECNLVLNKKSNSYNVEEILNAIRVFGDQLTDTYNLTTDLNEASYIIITYNEYLGIVNEELLLRSQDRRYYIIFESDEQFSLAMRNLNPQNSYKWTRKYDKNITQGYEVTSIGDRRFSPFFMWIRDENYKELTTIESYYQKVIKGWETGGKGLLPKNCTIEDAHNQLDELISNYLYKNRGLIYELALIGKTMTLNDVFDKGGGQNLTYCKILNKYFNLPDV